MNYKFFMLLTLLFGFYKVLKTSYKISVMYPPAGYLKEYVDATSSREVVKAWMVESVEYETTMPKVEPDSLQVPTREIKKRLDNTQLALHKTNASIKTSNDVDRSKIVRSLCLNISDPIVRDLQLGKIKPSSKPRTLYFRSLGRLGNALFQVAALYGLLNATGSRGVVTAGYGLYRHPFKEFKFFEINQHPPNLSIPTFTFGHGYDKVPAIIKAALEGDIKVTSYFQNLKYFEGCLEDIRKLFVFKEEYTNRAKSYLQTICAKNNGRQSSGTTKDSTVVGIHIRRGDFTNEYHYQQGYRNPDKSYFKRAMDYFRKKYKNVRFVVATNDKKWVKENFIAGDIFYSNLTRDVDDLAMLSECDHVIQSSGTFGWWAAFLCKGTSIYYKDWIAPGSLLHKSLQYKHKERFLPYWIPM